MRRALHLTPLALFLVAGCSALIDPDEGLLGGDGREDGGGIDAGMDGGPPPPDAPPGPDAPSCPEGCDDGVACTDDACNDGSCLSLPDDGACADGERCQIGVGCVARMCGADGDCNDRLHCNGTERCAPMSPGSDPVTGCVPGEPPPCDDGFSCTTDACDEDADACANTPD